MDFQQQIQTRNYMFDELEYEDDVFYSELRKQVLQLTAEDDDQEQELVYGNKNLNMVAAAQKQGLDGFSAGRYNWPEEKAAPAWIMSLWKTGNGTGVFIPQIVQTKKKNRPRRRRRNERGRTYRQVEKNCID